MAATLAGGLHGIAQELEMPPRAAGNAYELPPDVALPLPRTLGEAIELFAASSLAREFFGDAFVDHYVAMRRWEVEQYNRVVGTWERERYFEMV
jgi:glutamine synthetase